MGGRWAGLLLLCLVVVVGLFWRHRRQLRLLGVAGVIMVLAGCGRAAPAREVRGQGRSRWITAW